MFGGLASKAEYSGCRTIPIGNANSRIELCASDPDWIVIETHVAGLATVLDLPRVAAPGKAFYIRLIADLQENPALNTDVVTVNIPSIRSAGVALTYGIGPGWWYPFVYTERGWLAPPGGSGTDGSSSSGAIVIGNGAVASQVTSSRRCGVAIGPSTRATGGTDGGNNGAAGVAIGDSANAQGASVAIGSSAIVSNGSGVAIGASAHATSVSGNGGGVAVGSIANADSQGVAIGNSGGISSPCNGSSQGVAVGWGAQAAGAVGIGFTANADSGATALGYNTSATGNGGMAVALGNRTSTQRYGEVAHSCDAASTTLRSWSMLDWYGDTTDATATELFLGGHASSRAVLLNSSAFTFQIQLIARDNVNNVTSGWLLQGVIRRGANAAATSLVGAVTTTILGQDAGAAAWGVAITADATNGSLKIAVTGAAATTIRWNARADISELRF